MSRLPEARLSRRIAGTRAKVVLQAKGLSFTEIDVTHDPAGQAEMMERSARRTVPQIIIQGDHEGGYDDLSALEAAGDLDPLLARDENEGDLHAQRLIIVESGPAGYTAAIYTARALTQLEEERDELGADFEQSEEPTPLRLHPKLAETYAQKVADLEKTLKYPTIRDEAAEILRSLIDRIEVHPRSDRGAIFTSSATSPTSSRSQTKQAQKDSTIPVHQGVKRRPDTCFTEIIEYFPIEVGRRPADRFKSGRKRIYSLIFAPNLPLVAG